MKTKKDTQLLEHRLLSRRALIKGSAVALAALPILRSRLAVGPVAGATRKEIDPWHGLKVGVASYTFRKQPLDYTIKAIQRLGLKYVSIKDAHLPLKSTADERRSVVQKFKNAGIAPLSCGNISMKENNEAAIRPFFEYARDAQLPTIVCAPSPSLMPLLDKLVKEYDIRLAIHNHGPGDEFPSPFDVLKVIEPYDRRIGLCIDVGHTLRAKVDPAEAIIKCHERLYDLHLKDLESDDVNAANVEMGRGVMNIKAILRGLIRINYPYLTAFEFEKDADDPLPGLAESVGYAKALLVDPNM